MKYICLGYYDPAKHAAMTEGELQTMFDTCFEYDDHLRASGHGKCRYINHHVSLPIGRDKRFGQLPDFQQWRHAERIRQTTRGGTELLSDSGFSTARFRRMLPGP